MKEKLKKIASDCGAFQVGILPTEGLRTYEDVFDICKLNSCGRYGKTWACPPALGTLEECRTRFLAYDSMLLFTGKYDLEDSFDYEGMVEGQHRFHALVERLAALVREESSDVLIVANGGCHRCDACTYPDAPCRFPDSLYPALEGMGFHVAELAKAAGINYINGENTVTYFGAVFFEKH